MYGKTMFSQNTGVKYDAENLVVYVYIQAMKKLCK